MVLFQRQIGLRAALRHQTNRAAHGAHMLHGDHTITVDSNLVFPVVRGNHDVMFGVVCALEPVRPVLVIQRAVLIADGCIRFRPAGSLLRNFRNAVRGGIDWQRNGGQCLASVLTLILIVPGCIACHRDRTCRSAGRRHGSHFLGVPLGRDRNRLRIRAPCACIRLYAVLCTRRRRRLATCVPNMDVRCGNHGTIRFIRNRNTARVGDRRGGGNFNIGRNLCIRCRNFDRLAIRDREINLVSAAGIAHVDLLLRGNDDLLDRLRVNLDGSLRGHARDNAGAAGSGSPDLSAGNLRHDRRNGTGSNADYRSFGGGLNDVAIRVLQRSRLNRRNGRGRSGNCDNRSGRRRGSGTHRQGADLTGVAAGAANGQAACRGNRCDIRLRTKGQCCAVGGVDLVDLGVHANSTAGGNRRRRKCRGSRVRLNLRASGRGNRADLRARVAAGVDRTGNGHSADRTLVAVIERQRTGDARLSNLRGTLERHGVGRGNRANRNRLATGCINNGPSVRRKLLRGGVVQLDTSILRTRAVRLVHHDFVDVAIHQFDGVRTAALDAQFRSGDLRQRDSAVADVFADFKRTGVFLLAQIALNRRFRSLLGWPIAAAAGCNRALRCDLGTRAVRRRSGRDGGILGVGDDRVLAGDLKCGRDRRLVLQRNRRVVRRYEQRGRGNAIERHCAAVHALRDHNVRRGRALERNVVRHNEGDLAALARRERLLTALVHVLVNGLIQQRHYACAVDVNKRIHLAVHALNVALVGQSVDQTHRPAAAVSRQTLGRALLLQAQATREHHEECLAGQRAVRVHLVVAHAVQNTGVDALVDRVIVPLVCLHVAERSPCRAILKLEQLREHRRRFRAGHVVVGTEPTFVTGDDAVLAPTFNGRFCPMALRVRVLRCKHDGYKAHDERKGQKPA